MVKTWLAFGASFILAFSLMGQEHCNCGEFSEKQLAQLIEEDDSNAVVQKVTTLQGKKNEACRFYGGLLQLDYALATIDTLNAARYLKELRKQIKGTPCHKRWSLTLKFSELHLLKLRQDYERMAKEAYTALNQSRSLKDEKGEVRAMKELVYVFNRVNEDDKVWKYVQLAKNKLLKSNDTDAEDYIWLAFSYETHYTLTEQKKYVDSAEFFALKARSLLKPEKDLIQFIQVYRALEACAYHNGDLDQALVYIDSAIWYGQRVPGRINLGTLYISKAWDHLDLGQNELAVQWMDTCIRYNKKYGIGMAGMDMIYLQAAQIFEAAGEVDRALEAYKQYSHLKDSLFTSERTATINELEQKYEKAQDERKIAELNERQRTYVFIIVAGVLLIVILIFVFRQRILRNRQKMLETEQRLNRARIEPHFFFNALTSIQNKAIEERSPLTVSLLSRFSRIMRQSLDSSYTEFVSLQEDVDFLRQYLELQQMRNPDKFDFEISLDPTIDAELLLFPGMLLQPIVENSVEHGFRALDFPGELLISFSKKGGALQVDVEDNGMESEQSTPKTHISRATQIIEDRLFLLRKTTRKPAAYQRIPKEEGYHIRLIIPIIPAEESKTNR